MVIIIGDLLKNVRESMLLQKNCTLWNLKGGWKDKAVGLKKYNLRGPLLVQRNICGICQTKRHTLLPYFMNMGVVMTSWWNEVPLSVGQ